MAMMKIILFLAFCFFLQGVLGGIICEQLPKQLCSYSVSSSGKRCLLENFASSDGTVTYQCKTSEVIVDVVHDWIETEECTNACGVDRKSVGISSDSLLQPQFTAKLCSDACYQNCPNIVDLYFNLALGEGVYLPTLCEAQRTNPRRAMSDIKSSGAAWGPASAKNSRIAWGSSSSTSSSVACGPSSSTSSGEASSPAPSPMGYGEAWSSSSSAGYGEASSPAPSPTGYGDW
ncbi:PAR1 protein [Citrus sinensis]|uniref:PAR1 protein n=3 Tax=Citrus sinensis TaxID=2711 RepID=A0ACB8IXZ6_CITSI|nr:PAR1 protein [Citrus sinensis]KAH9701547.1 PAR1 protein [Citrus sinensis]